MNCFFIEHHTHTTHGQIQMSGIIKVWTFSIGYSVLIRWSFIGHELITNENSLFFLAVSKPAKAHSLIMLVYF